MSVARRKDDYMALAKPSPCMRSGFAASGQATPNWRFGTAIVYDAADQNGNARRRFARSQF